MELIESKALEHNGLVKSVCDELGIKELVDNLLPPNSEMKLTHGERLIAMILNGLGFHSEALYLSPSFFDHLPLEILFGKEIQAEWLNDDALGRTLDAIDAAGSDVIFSRIAFAACKKAGVNSKFQHHDTSVMQLAGKYDEGVELVRFGRPKNGKKGVKQFLISLMVSNDGGIPLLASAIPGDSSDKTHFREVITKLKNEMKESTEDIYHVADSALYTKETLVELASSPMKFITRVPYALKVAKEACLKHLEFTEIDENYSYSEFENDYAGVKQRWILVLSEHAKKKEALTLHKAIRKERKEIRTQLKKLKATDYACASDAETALIKLEKGFKFHRIKDYSVEERGVRKKCFKIQSRSTICKRKLEPARLGLGKFIVATNELDTAKLNPEEILNYYKDQGKVERGFRFLNNPLCMADAVFLKKESRIRALVVVMCLCLLVYAIAEKKLRKILVETGETIPSQTKKPTQKPTMKWVFKLFRNIQVAYILHNDRLSKQIINLKPAAKTLVSILQLHLKRFYEFTPEGCGM
jgi:transposase